MKKLKQVELKYHGKVTDKLPRLDVEDVAHTINDLIESVEELRGEIAKLADNQDDIAQIVQEVQEAVKEIVMQREEDKEVDKVIGSGYYYKGKVEDWQGDVKFLWEQWEIMKDHIYNLAKKLDCAKTTQTECDHEWFDTEGLTSNVIFETCKKCWAVKPKTGVHHTPQIHEDCEHEWGIMTMPNSGGMEECTKCHAVHVLKKEPRYKSTKETTYDEFGPSDLYTNHRCYTVAELRKKWQEFVSLKEHNNDGFFDWLEKDDR